MSVNGGTFVTVASNKVGSVLLQDGSGAWQSADVDVTSLVAAGGAAPSVRVRFGFDTVDSTLNTYSGFLVDDVEVRAFTSTCSASTECDDGAYCNGAEQCSGGLCVPGTPVDCNDGVSCTTDSCNEATDSCTQTPNSGLCDDGNVCNGAETCDATGCQVGTTLNCNDNDACTTDSCNAISGCQNVAVLCNDNNECTSDSCNAESGCQYQNNTSSCSDDADSCTSDVCSAGICTHPDNGTCGGDEPFQESGGMVVMEAEHFHVNTARSNHDWTLTADGGASGGSLMSSTPNNGTNINGAYDTTSPELDFKVNFTQAGTYYVWVRGAAANGDDDSCHVGINGTGPASADRISSFGTSLGWTKNTMDGVVATIVVSTPGVHTVNLWMREDGFKFDKLLLTTNSSYTPTGAGPAESPRGGTQGCTGAPDCDDNNPCTADSCVAGACQNSAIANGTACTSDNNVCTDDVCSAGTCTHPDNGTCGGTPCTDLCTAPVTFGQSYSSGNLGTNATCHETTANLQGGNCGNFAEGRTLKVNGATMTCNNGNWSVLPPKVNDGYCVQTSAGNHAWAYFTTW